jgi:hypothetical protein
MFQRSEEGSTLDADNGAPIDIPDFAAAASERLFPLGRPQKCPHFAKPFPHSFAIFNVLSHPEPALEIAIPLAPGTARASGTAVHSTAPPAADSGLPAPTAATGLGAAPGGFGHIRKAALDIGLAHGVVYHFCPASVLLTIPTRA